MIGVVSRICHALLARVWPRRGPGPSTARPPPGTQPARCRPAPRRATRSRCAAGARARPAGSAIRRSRRRSGRASAMVDRRRPMVTLALPPSYRSRAYSSMSVRWPSKRQGGARRTRQRIRPNVEGAGLTGSLPSSARKPARAMTSGSALRRRRGQGASSPPWRLRSLGPEPGGRRPAQVSVTKARTRSRPLRSAAKGKSRITDRRTARAAFVRWHEVAPAHEVAS